MNKNDLINLLTKTLGSKSESKLVIERLFTGMKQALTANEKVIVSGFGSFHVKLSRAKKLMNPKTKKMMFIPPRKKIKFKPSKDLLI